MKYNPYFLFDGKAEEAILLYAKAFQAEYQILKYKDAPPNPNFKLPNEMMDKVMHGEVRFGDMKFMICDASVMNPSTNGNQVQISLVFEDVNEFNKVYEVLGVDAKVAVAPSKSFFAEYYANFTDKLGVTWHFIVEKQH